DVGVRGRCFVMLKTKIEMDKAADILKLLGNETRLTMLKILDDHDCCVCEFVEIFQASQPSISQHIRKLRDIGLVKDERRGQWIFYSINIYDHVCCVCVFVASFQASLPSISKNIRKLRDIGLVKEERRGQWIFYSINNDSEFYPFILQLLNLLPQQNEKLKELEEKGT